MTSNEYNKLTINTLAPPLLPPTSEDWMLSHINQSSGKTSNTLTHKVLKTALGVIVLLRNLSFIPLSLKLPMGELLAAGNVVSVSILDFWAGGQFVDDLLPSKASLDSAMETKQRTTAYKVALLGIILSSLVAQIPQVYPAMKYNPGSLSIPIGIIVGLGGAVLPMRSMQLGLEDWLNRASAKSAGINTHQKQELLRILEESRQAFINLPQQEKNEFIQKIESIRSMDDSSDKIENYWSQLTQTLPPAVKEELSILSRGVTGSTKALGISTTAIYQVIIGLYTYAGAKEILFDNDTFAGVTAFGVVLVSLYLTQMAMVNSAVEIAERRLGINPSAYPPTLAEQYHGKTMKGAQIAGQIINLLALGVTYTIWHDFFEDPDTRLGAEVIICVAIFLLLYQPTTETIDAISESLIYRFGTDEQKASISTAREYQDLTLPISRTSPEGFQEIWDTLPAELQEKINETNPLKRDSLSKDELEKV